MAGEDEAGDGAPERAAPKASGFGRRTTTHVPAGGLARAAASIERAVEALGRAASIKPKGLSWGLVLCIVAIIVWAVLALINRPRIDDGVAYYAATAAAIFSALMADRRGWLSGASWLKMLLVVFLGVVVWRGLVEVYWYGAYKARQAQGPGKFLINAGVQEMLAFDNPWCEGWFNNAWSCRLVSGLNTTERAEWISHFEIVRENERVLCVASKKSVGGAAPIGSCEATLPSWCVEWWNGRYPMPNTKEQWINHAENMPGMIFEPNRLRREELYPGKCIKTRWES
jgi:hypothetical protein